MAESTLRWWLWCIEIEDISCLAQNTKRKVFLQRLVSTQYKASIDICILPCPRDKDENKLRRVQRNDEEPFHFYLREFTAFPKIDVLFYFEKSRFYPYVFRTPLTKGVRNVISMSVIFPQSTWWMCCCDVAFLFVRDLHVCKIYQIDNVSFESAWPIWT